MSGALPRLPCSQRAILPGNGTAMSIGLILLIILVVFLLGGVSGRFGGYGYDYGHGGIGGSGMRAQPAESGHC
jgi:hypothetical protein